MNKYIKNKKYKIKQEKRYQREEPYSTFGVFSWLDEDVDSQYLNHLKWEEKWKKRILRGYDKGFKRGEKTPPRWYVNIKNRRIRYKNKDRIRKEKFDHFIPYKKNAHWDWF